MNTHIVSNAGRKVRVGLLLGTVAMSGLMAACDPDTTAPESGARVQVLLTDAPTDMLDSALVWISHVYLVGGPGAVPDTAEADGVDSGEGKVDLFNDPANPLVFDLLQLRNGITADLTGQVDVDLTSFRGLRFVVDSARVVLAEGFTFEDGSTVGSMKVPSSHSSGIKVKLSDILEVTQDQTLVITVDFDVEENFKIQTDTHTGAVKKVIFKPVLREKHRHHN